MTPSARPASTTLSAASAVGATNIKVASVAGFVVGQTIKIDTAPNQESDVITSVGTAGPTGTGLGLATPLTLGARERLDRRSRRPGQRG